jgi:Cu+-exporting ATPase
MKSVKIIFFILLISCIHTACNKKSQIENRIEQNISENLKNIEVQIDGMTCEIGCARLIQSKLYKAEGIKFAQVSFEDSLGIITYDANRISQTEIKDVIQNVAGGDLYKVVTVNEVVSFTNKTE